MIDRVIILAGATSIIVGLLFLITSTLHIAAGKLLWRCLKKGGKLGVALSILGITISIPLSIILKSITNIVTGTLFNVILLVLMVVGWRKLR